MTNDKEVWSRSNLEIIWNKWLFQLWHEYGIFTKGEKSMKSEEREEVAQIDWKNMLNLVECSKQAQATLNQARVEEKKSQSKSFNY